MAHEFCSIIKKVDNRDSSGSRVLFDYKKGRQQGF